MDAVDLMSDMVSEASYSSPSPLHDHPPPTPPTSTQLLDPFMPGDNLDEEGRPRSFSFEPGSLALKATEFTASRLEEVGSSLEPTHLPPRISASRPDPTTHAVCRSGHGRRVSAGGHAHPPGVRGACGGRARTAADGEGVHGHPRFRECNQSRPGNGRRAWRGRSRSP